MKVASTGDVGLDLVLDGVGRGRGPRLACSFVHEARRCVDKETNLSRVKRGDVSKSDLRELGSFS